MYRKKEALPFLADRLKLLRRVSGMTQQELADILHVERCTYAFYESGKSHPDLGLILRIARIYKITVDHLIDPDCDFFSRPASSLNESPMPVGTQKTIELSQRDRNEKQLLLLFRQMNKQQQQEAIEQMTRILVPSENN